MEQIIDLEIFSEVDQDSATTEPWTNERLLSLLHKVSRPTTRENVDLDFDPDDYPLYY